MEQEMTIEEKAKFEAMDILWVSSVENYQAVMKMVLTHVKQVNKADGFLCKMEQKYGIKRTKIEPESDET